MVSYVRGRTRVLSDAEIVTAYLEGESSTGLALRANCDASTVLDLVRSSGHPVRHRGPERSRRVLPLTDAEICRLYKEGASGPMIAARCHISVSVIYAILRRNNVPLRSPVASCRVAARAARIKRRKETPP